MARYEEKRKGIKPVPDDPLGYLNEAQIFTFRRVQRDGWHIKFLRRKPFQRPVCVVANKNESMLAIIEANGFLNKEPDIPLRTIGA